MAGDAQGDQVGCAGRGYRLGERFRPQLYRGRPSEQRGTVNEIYAPFGSNDYAPFIQQIKSSGAEGLWVALAGRDAINFATQAHDFGILDEYFSPA